MRFIMCVIAKGDEPASAEEMTAIDAFNDGMRDAGQLILAAGLFGPDKSKVIDNRADAGVVTAGPLHDLPEHMAGFWLIEAADEATAEQLALAGSKACNRKVELRPLHG
jgi:hypothetical protein